MGERLALGARAIAYNEDNVYWTGPLLQNASVSSKTEVTITFRATGQEGLRVKHSVGFELRLGGHWLQAPIARWNGSALVVAVPGPPKGEPADANVSAVRYNWYEGACLPREGPYMCAVYAAAEGLPAAPFIASLDGSPPLPPFPPPAPPPRPPPSPTPTPPTPIAPPSPPRHQHIPVPNLGTCSGCGCADPCMGFGEHGEPQHPNSCALPQVLLIGDSIAGPPLGYAPDVQRILGYASAPTVPNGSSAPYGVAHVQFVAGFPSDLGIRCMGNWTKYIKWSSGGFDVIHYNSGLHDVDKTEFIPPEQYVKNLAAVHELAMQALKPRGTFIWASTTPVPYPTACELQCGCPLRRSRARVLLTPSLY
eukprot:SAG11_NODE_1873_length_4150_cov_1.815354_2_plen_365_part_00